MSILGFRFLITPLLLKTLSLGANLILRAGLLETYSKNSFRVLGLNQYFLGRGGARMQGKRRWRKEVGREGQKGGEEKTEPSGRNISFT